MQLSVNLANYSTESDNVKSSHYLWLSFTTSQKQIFTLVNYIFLCGFISMFGIVTNVINMIVFYRQGLNTTTNISFFSLAVSDLCSLLIQQLFNFYINPMSKQFNLPMSFTEVQYLTSSIPRQIFARITFFITVYMTAERCLCVTFPLRIKQMITTRKTIVILIHIYIVIIICVLPIYTTHYLGWKFYPERNKTLLGLIILRMNNGASTTVYVIHSLSGLLAFLVILILTSILLTKLKEKSSWRKTANMHQDKSGSISSRDRTTMTMVALIACILIICYTPSTLLGVATVVEPEFGVGGKYYNLYSFFWSFAFIFENINSSVNIFMYLKMSSKYRAKCKEIFCRSRTAHEP